MSSHIHPGDKEIGKALGRVPSGVYILTAQHDGRSTAMMASWVQQASFTPPALSVGIAKDRPIARMIQASRTFALSVVPEHDESHIMRKYARGVPENEDPFAGMKTEKTPVLGLPVLSDALAIMECRVMQVVSFSGDHELYIGEIVGGKLTREGKPFIHLRGSGFHY
jgi:flavin reductase (DIM6/NTAB) family NADH-FMN oxidoreductase RutF